MGVTRPPVSEFGVAVVPVAVKRVRDRRCRLGTLAMAYLLAKCPHYTAPGDRHGRKG
jgi:hypothetical protein